MQRLEVRGAARPLHGSLGVKGLVSQLLRYNIPHVLNLLLVLNGCCYIYVYIYIYICGEGARGGAVG